jgi:hypothetical protein
VDSLDGRNFVNIGGGSERLDELGCGRVGLQINVRNRMVGSYRWGCSLIPTVDETPTGQGLRN